MAGARPQSASVIASTLRSTVTIQVDAAPPQATQRTPHPRVYIAAEARGLREREGLVMLYPHNVCRTVYNTPVGRTPMYQF